MEAQVQVLTNDITRVHVVWLRHPREVDARGWVLVVRIHTRVLDMPHQVRLSVLGPQCTPVEADAVVGNNDLNRAVEADATVGNDGQNGAWAVHKGMATRGMATRGVATRGMATGGMATRGM